MSPALSEPSYANGIVAMRPFVPASDFEKSLRFYTQLGFTAHRLGDSIAEMILGAFAFLLQSFEAPGFAGNYMMQLMVEDLDWWWNHIQSLNLAANFGVRPPSPPALQPWGLVLSYVVDPSGVLWHIVQKPNKS